MSMAIYTIIHVLVDRIVVPFFHDQDTQVITRQITPGFGSRSEILESRFRYQTSQMCLVNESRVRRLNMP